MKGFFISIFTCLSCIGVVAQSDLQQLYDTQKAFEQTAADKGIRSAFLEYLADDSVIFHPNAVNGRAFWKARENSSPALLIRNPTYTDIAANGLVGYTTGNWELYPKGKTDPLAKFGQYVTIWEKKQDGKFRVSLDIDITHEKLSLSEIKRITRIDKRILPINKSRDLNRRGWSAVDSSMNFLRMSMSNKALGGAYEKFAARDVRLLREREPPIIGRKNVVSATKRYTSIEFPKKTAMHESADMAYVWNACEYANSLEGTEKGNCLHIWKLRDKKWMIVLGVFARVSNETQPTLKNRQKNRRSQ